MTHLSDSGAQNDAEATIVALLSTELGVPLGPAGNIPVGNGAHVRLDAISPDKTVLVEAYARQGTLKGAQLKKVAQDVLKLQLLRTRPGYEGARAIIVFGSDEARHSVRGWLAQAAEQFAVELATVDLPDQVRADITRAQARQVMVNLSADEAAALDTDT